MGALARAPTISDVARVAGVSKITVSRVVNRSDSLTERTRQQVERVIADLGFRPNPQARALALRRNFLIALVHANPNPQTVLQVEQGMLEALQGSDFELVVRLLDRDAATMREDLHGFIVRQRPYGVLLMPPLSEDDGLAALCAESGCRYVRMGSAALDGPEHLVSSNDRAAVREAVRHLVALGHRRIALVAGPQGFRSADERRAGFEAALAEAGLLLPRSLVAQGDYRFESGLAAAERLLDHSPRPTAIFACNDEMAAGVLHAAGQRGIGVPEQLSVIGFDDGHIAPHLWPPLTTVRWPIASMARSAALKLIAGPGAAPEPSHFASTLVRRASAAPPGEPA